MWSGLHQSLCALLSGVYAAWWLWLKFAPLHGNRRKSLRSFFAFSALGAFQSAFLNPLFDVSHPVYVWLYVTTTPLLATVLLMAATEHVLHRIKPESIWTVSAAVVTAWTLGAAALWNLFPAATYKDAAGLVRIYNRALFERGVAGLYAMTGSVLTVPWMLDLLRQTNALRRGMTGKRGKRYHIVTVVLLLATLTRVLYMSSSYHPAVAFVATSVQVVVFAAGLYLYWRDAL